MSKPKRCAGCSQPKRVLIKASVTDQEATFTMGLKWLCVECLLTGGLALPRMAFDSLPAAVRERWVKWSGWEGL